MKEASPKRQWIVWFYFYEISRIGKSIETENSSCQRLGGGGNWNWLLLGIEFLLGDENFGISEGSEQCMNTLFLKNTDLHTLKG